MGVEVQVELRTDSKSWRHQVDSSAQEQLFIDLPSSSPHGAQHGGTKSGSLQGNITLCNNCPKPS
jgi:hypothetical protein